MINHNKKVVRDILVRRTVNLKATSISLHFFEIICLLIIYDLIIDYGYNIIKL